MVFSFADTGLVPALLVADSAPPSPQLLALVGRVAEHVARGGDAEASDEPSDAHPDC